MLGHAERMIQIDDMTKDLHHILLTAMRADFCGCIVTEDNRADTVTGMHHAPSLQEDFVDRVAAVARNYTKPIVACDIGETEMALFVRSRYDKLGIPSFTSPEDAAKAMAALVEYGLYLKKHGYFEQYMEGFQRDLLTR